MKTKKIPVVLLFLFSFCGTVTAQQIPAATFAPKREFRGVWIATVENIDWPQKVGETSEKQKEEMVNILNEHQKAGINAVMFQVRPAADALYEQSFEPWSKYLSGQQGKAPDPVYDPLTFAISEAHQRGLELHAWFNPYRATKDTNYAALSPNHITSLKPDWFFVYGNMKLFNPGLPEVRAYIVKVILNVVDHYKVDGIHMDDYFYPYQVAGETIADSETYKKYGTGFSSIEDWRRNNIDLLVKMLDDSIHRHNPAIKFGISPSCIWANKSQNPDGSETHGGDTYYQLYADTRKWIKEGWIDYINPQIYHSQNDSLVNYNILVDWWSNHSYGRHVYIGQGPYRIVASKLNDFKNPAEIPNQIKYLRKNARVQGSVYFTSNSLLKNPLGVTDSLRNNYYQHPALPPVMLWRDSVAPNPPQKLTATINEGKVLLDWKPPIPAKDKEPVYGYAVYRFDKNEKINLDDPKHLFSIRYNNKTSCKDESIEQGKTYVYIVTALDQMKNESGKSRSVMIKIPL